MEYIKKTIVVPGQIVAEGFNVGENCFREGSKIFSSIYGLARIEKNHVEVIPLNGVYVPKENDVVIGVVKEIYGNNFHIEINSPYEGVLIMPDIKNFKEYNHNVNYKDYNYKDYNVNYNVGEIISAVVEKVNEVGKCYLSKSFKITGGIILEINPKRVPRVIGKRRSMLEVIKQKTGCRMIVGQNGRIWIDGGKIEKAVKIIKYIEENAYKSGLTDRVIDIF